MAKKLSEIFDDPKHKDEAEDFKAAVNRCMDDRLKAENDKRKTESTVGLFDWIFGSDAK